MVLNEVWYMRSIPASVETQDTNGASLLSKLGPGLITGAADDDPSGIATYSQGGAQFGYNVLWTVLVTYPLMVGIQLVSARIGRVTGKGLTENLIAQGPKPVVYALICLLFIANVINLGADLNAMGEAAALIVGKGKFLFSIGFAIGSLLLLTFMSYQRYVNLLKWLTLSLFAYVGVVFFVDVDWPAVARAAIVPEIHANKDYITTIVAILGTTISPYLFFWQAAEEVQDIRRIPADEPLSEAPEQGRHQLQRLRIDTFVGMGVSNIIAFFMIVSTAATLHTHGITDIQTIAQAAAALKPIAGAGAFILFALGIIGTGLLALPVLAGSAAYAIASLFHWRRGFDRKLQRAPYFYGVTAGALLIGVILAIIKIDPMKALFWSAVVNAVIATPIMIAIMILASSQKTMGKFAIGIRLKILGWLATAAMAIASLAMFVAMAI